MAGVVHVFRRCCIRGGGSQRHEQRRLVALWCVAESGRARSYRCHPAHAGQVAPTVKVPRGPRCFILRTRVVVEAGWRGNPCRNGQAMPKNRSASLRTKARNLASAESISHSEALRQLTQARTNVEAESSADNTATSHWLPSAQPGGLSKTTVEAPFPFHLAKCPPLPSANIPANALLVELMKTSDNYNFVLFDTAPAEDDVTTQWLRAQLGEQGYTELLNSLASDDAPNEGAGS